MFSDRGDAAATTFSSMCATTADASLLAYHVVTGDPAPLLKKLARIRAPGAVCEKARFNFISRTAAVDLIREVRGRPPVWEWPEYRGGTCHDKESCRPILQGTKIRTAVWDFNPMHAHMLNHMRFYITDFMPPEVKASGKVILIDDDIIIMKDIRKMWDAGVEDENTPPEQRGEKILAITCNVWEWANGGGYTGRGGWEWIGVEGRRSDERRNMLQSAVTGFKMVDIANHTEPECTPEDRELIANSPERFYRGCTEPGLLAELKETAVEILGEDAVEKLMPNGPWNDTAWNYGVTLVDVSAAHRLHAVEVYEKWVTAVLRKKLYPTTSIAFGLGIPYLAFMGRVTCFRDLPEKELAFILEGLGFVTARALKWNFNGRSFQKMAEEEKAIFAMHFNGERKPQVPDKAIPDYLGPFLEHTSPEVVQAHAMKREADQERRLLDSALPPPIPFVLLTSPRSGSEFVMASIDRHPLICSTGEVEKPGDEDRLGWPREAMMPPQLFNDERIKYVAEESFGKLQCHYGALSKMLTRHLRFAKAEGSKRLLEHCGAVYTQLWDKQVDETARNALTKHRASLLVKGEYEFELTPGLNRTYNDTDLLMLLPDEMVAQMTKPGIDSMLELEYASCDFLRLAWREMKSHKSEFGHLPDYNRTKHRYGDVVFSLYIDFAFRGGNTGEAALGNQRDLGGAVYGKLDELNRALEEASLEVDPERQRQRIDAALKSVATPPLPFHVGSPDTASHIGSSLSCRCAPSSRAIGFKVMHTWYRAWHHKARMHDYYADILPRLSKTHPDTKVVVLDRANPLRLMLSLLRAEHNLEEAMKENNGTASAAYDWHDGQKGSSSGGPQVTKDKTRFPLDVARIVQEVQWEMHLRGIRDDMLKALGMPVLRLRYEDCAKDIKTCVDAVAEFLGLPAMNLIGAVDEQAAKTAEKESGGKEDSGRKASSILDEITNPDELLEAVKKRRWTKWLES